MKITRRQLRRLIREQVEPDCGESVGRKRLDMSLDDTGPHMKNAVIRAVMEVINTYRCMTSTTDLNPKVQAYRAEQRRKATEESEESEEDLKNTEKHWTFEQYVDFALDDIKAKVFGGDYSVPRDMVGMREMKINKADLKRIIKEEISRLSEVRRSPAVPASEWQDEYVRPDYEGGEDRGLAASEYTLPPPPKPPAKWRSGQRVSWNNLARAFPRLAVPDNYEFFLKAHDKVLADYLKDSKDPDTMASALSMIALEAKAREAQAREAQAREAQDLGPSASQPATTGFPDLDAKLRGLPPGHVDLSQLSESRIDLGRWNKMAGTLLCEADYHDFGIPVPAGELRPQSLGLERAEEREIVDAETGEFYNNSVPVPKKDVLSTMGNSFRLAKWHEMDPLWRRSDPDGDMYWYVVNFLAGEQEMFDAAEKRHMEGGVKTKFLDWANLVLKEKGLPTATPGDDSNLYQIGNSLLHGPPYDAWTSGVQPADYASDMEVLPLPTERGVTV